MDLLPPSLCTPPVAGWTSPPSTFSVHSPCGYHLLCAPLLWLSGYHLFSAQARPPPAASSAPISPRTAAAPATRRDPTTRPPLSTPAAASRGHPSTHAPTRRQAALFLHRVSGPPCTSRYTPRRCRYDFAAQMLPILLALTVSPDTPLPTQTSSPPIPNVSHPFPHPGASPPFYGLIDGINLYSPSGIPPSGTPPAGPFPNVACSFTIPGATFCSPPPPLPPTPSPPPAPPAPPPSPSPPPPPSPPAPPSPPPASPSPPAPPSPTPPPPPVCSISVSTFKYYSAAMPFNLTNTGFPAP